MLYFSVQSFPYPVSVLSSWFEGHSDRPKRAGSSIFADVRQNHRHFVPSLLQMLYTEFPGSLPRPAKNGTIRTDRTGRRRSSMARVSLDNHLYFLNRDISWLAFNRRVLEEASDEGNPLLERLKFLAISASNLDEFFEVRVAAMMQQIEDGYNEAGPDGLSLSEKRDLLSKLTHEFVDHQYDCWNARLRPALADNGIRVLGLHELDAEALRFVDEYCEKELDPLLTPVTVDPAHPFPRVINKALCLGFLLRRRRRSALTYTGVVSVPRALPRLVSLPSSPGTADFIFLADLVAHHALRMYRGYDIVSSAPFRVTRNSNLYLAEEEARSLLESVRTELHNRRKGDAVRMEIEADADPEIIER